MVRKMTDNNEVDGRFLRRIEQLISVNQEAQQRYEFYGLLKNVIL